MFFFSIIWKDMKPRAVKKIETQNTVLFIALVPDEMDWNWDVISAEEIKKAAYEFMLNLQNKKVNVNHEDNTEIDSAHFVESYLTLFDMDRWDDDVIPAWTWIVWIQFDDDTFNKIIDWEFVWISIEWVGQYDF